MGRWWTNTPPSISCQVVHSLLGWTGFWSWWPKFCMCSGGSIWLLEEGCWKGRRLQHRRQAVQNWPSVNAKQVIAYFPSKASMPDILFQFILDYLATVKLIPFVSLPQQPFQWLSLQLPSLQHSATIHLPGLQTKITAPAQKNLLASKRLARTPSGKIFGAQQSRVTRNSCDTQVKHLPCSPMWNSLSNRLTPPSGGFVHL